MEENDLKDLHRDFDQHVEFEDQWKAQNAKEHLEIKDVLKGHSVDLADIKLSMAGRERYEQGIKHGVAGLWGAAVAAGAVVWAWITRGDGS